MFSTPLIPCSSGATTVSATMSALAPGYWPVTRTTGGAISGYWAIGSRGSATAPTISSTTDKTAAKIGRSMKKCERRMSVGSRLNVGGRRRLRVGRDLCARPCADQPVDDDTVVSRNSLNHAHPIDDRSEGDILRTRHIAGVDHHDELACLLSADRSLRHEQSIGGRRRRHLQAREH